MMALPKLLPPEVLYLIFERLDWFDLARISVICKTWKAIAADNRLWKRQFKKNKTLLAFNSVHDFITALESVIDATHQNQESKKQLIARVRNLDLKIGLVVDHHLGRTVSATAPGIPTKSASAPLTRRSVKHVKPPIFSKRKSESNLLLMTGSHSLRKSKTAILAKRDSELSVADLSFLEIKQQLDVFQSIIHLMAHIEDVDAESIHSSQALVAYAIKMHQSHSQHTATTPNLSPKVLLKIEHILQYAKQCEKAYKQSALGITLSFRNGGASSTGFFQLLFMNTIETMHTYMTQHSNLKSQLEVLNQVVLDLNNQFFQYDQYLRGVLERYSFKCKKAGRRHNYYDWEKKGIIVSATIPNEMKKQTSFALSNATAGLFNLLVYIGNKQSDLVSIDLSDLLEKIHCDIVTIRYENYLFNSKNILTTLEKHLLKMR